MNREKEYWRKEYNQSVNTSLNSLKENNTKPFVGLIALTAAMQIRNDRSAKYIWFEGLKDYPDVIKAIDSELNKMSVNITAQISKSKSDYELYLAGKGEYKNVSSEYWLDLIDSYSGFDWGLSKDIWYEKFSEYPEIIEFLNKLSDLRD